MIFGPFAEDTWNQLRPHLEKAQIPYRHFVDEDQIKHSHQSFAKQDGRIRPGGVHSPGFDYDPRAIKVEILDQYLPQLPPEVEKFGLVYSTWEPSPEDFQDEEDNKLLAQMKKNTEKRHFYAYLPQIITLAIFLSLYLLSKMTNN